MAGPPCAFIPRCVRNRTNRKKGTTKDNPIPDSPLHARAQTDCIAVLPDCHCTKPRRRCVPSNPSCFKRHCGWLGNNHASLDSTLCRVLRIPPKICVGITFCKLIQFGLEISKRDGDDGQRALPHALPACLPACLPAQRDDICRGMKK